MEIEQLVDKINDGTATLQDAMEFAAENAAGTTRKKNVPSLINALKKQEEAGNLPFSLSDKFNPKRVPKEIVDYLSENESLVYKFQNYEDTIEPALRDEGFSYSKGVGKESTSGLTQRGSPGQKSSAKLPMRGLVSASRQDDLYEAAFRDIDDIATASEDPLASKKATKMKEALLFHRLTGNRVERVFPESKSNLGSAITLGDFSEYTDEATGKTSLILTGGAAGKKSYFSFEYTDEMQDFVNSIKTRRLQELTEAGIDAEEAKKYPLFDITKKEAGDTWNATFKKRLNSPDFKDIAANIPKSEKTTLDTIALVRSMVPRSLRQENKVSSNVAEEFQGHVEKGIGGKSYTGDVPRSEAGNLSNYILRDSAFRSQDKTVNSLFDRLGLRSTDYFGNKKYTSTGFYRTTETVPKIAVEEITPKDIEISDSISEERDVNRAKSIAQTESETLDIKTKTAQQTIEAEPTLIEGAKSEARIEAARKDAADELTKDKKAASDAADKKVRSENLNKAIEVFNSTYQRLPSRVKKAIPFIGFLGAGIAAQQKGAEAKEAFEEGDYGTAVKRGAQAVEELVSPLPITTGDLEQMRRSPEEIELVKKAQSSRLESMQRRSERTRSKLDDQMNNLISQP